MKTWFKSGNLILLGGGIFLLFIFSLIFGFMAQDLQLVATDYYEQELSYNQKKEAIHNAEKIDSMLILKKAGGFFELTVPAGIALHLKSGTAHFYCPSDAKADRVMNLQPNSEGKFILRADGLKNCPYRLKVSLDDGAQKYFKEFYL